MRRTIILEFPLILSLLLTACDWRGFNIPNRYEHMRQELAALQAMNQAGQFLPLKYLAVSHFVRTFAPQLCEYLWNDSSTPQGRRSPTSTTPSTR